MSDVLRFAGARRTARGELHAGWLAGGTLTLYSAGSGVPADADTALTDQAALATFALPDPVGTVTDGVLTAEPIDTALVMVSDIVAFARAYSATDAVIADYDVGLVGSGAALEVDNLNLVMGAYVTVVSFMVTES
jgi:hypothetical protein